ncbi:MAG TPA: type II toxin-antitoxin system prevent-host-death family antitoxin [Terracidiphilus sp.]|jgi:prevent-host-death family protein|nr:type II toxin-antitoxin system prevent-host-death family antitoxin [Terracidiphilus sp.]
MVTMTSAEAQNRFGQMLETAQQQVVEITRHGRPAAFVVSPREHADLVELQRRRQQAADEFAAWRKQAGKSTRPEAAELTDAEIVRLVHELR